MDGTEIIASQGEIIPSCMKESDCPERYYTDFFHYEADKQIINAFKEDFLTGVDSLENLLNNYTDYAKLSPSDKANLIRWSGDCSYIIDPKGLICKVQRNKRFFITKKRLFACIFKGFGERR